MVAKNPSEGAVVKIYFAGGNYDLAGGNYDGAGANNYFAVGCFTFSGARNKIAFDSFYSASTSFLFSATGFAFATLCFETETG